MTSKPAGGGEGDPASWLARLPHGRHGLPRSFVVQNQRSRIAAGIIASVAERGYHGTSVSHIAAASGVSRRTFYQLFESKQACFFDTYDLIAEHLREVATEAAAKEESWPLQVRARLGAALEVFAANPDIVRFVFIAPPRAGSEVAERYGRAMDEVLAELTRGMPAEVAARQPSRAAQHALVGGGVALIVQRVEEGEGERLAEVLPDLVEVALTPFLGRDEAVRIAREEG